VYEVEKMQHKDLSKSTDVTSGVSTDKTNKNIKPIPEDLL
jgi:hypothetical protein